jgi:hypothetical protein
MYFAAEEVDFVNAPVPNGYSLCYVPNIDPCGGDIKPWRSSYSLEDAKVKAGQTLKDPKNCVLWIPRSRINVHKKITTTGCGKWKGDGGTFFLGKKISPSRSKVYEAEEEKQDEKIVIKSIKEKQDGEADYNFCSRSGISIDKNGLLYAIGTDFGAQGWTNPYLSGKVDIRFS